MLEIKEFNEVKIEESAVHIQDCEGWWLSGCRGSVAQHWWLKPEVPRVRLPAFSLSSISAYMGVGSIKLERLHDCIYIVQILSHRENVSLLAQETLQTDEQVISIMRSRP